MNRDVYGVFSGLGSYFEFSGMLGEADILDGAVSAVTAPDLRVRAWPLSPLPRTHQNSRHEGQFRGEPPPRTLCATRPGLSAGTRPGLDLTLGLDLTRGLALGMGAGGHTGPCTRIAPGVHWDSPRGGGSPAPPPPRARRPLEHDSPSQRPRSRGRRLQGLNLPPEPSDFSNMRKGLLH